MQGKTTTSLEQIEFDVVSLASLRRHSSKSDEEVFTPESFERQLLRQVGVSTHNPQTMG